MSSVTVRLSPETEQRLRDRAARGGQSLEAFLTHLAEQAAAATTPQAAMTPDQRSAEWRAWAASHRPTLGEADDSRESIYAGRGE